MIAYLISVLVKAFIGFLVIAVLCKFLSKYLSWSQMHELAFATILLSIIPGAYPVSIDDVFSTIGDQREDISIAHSESNDKQAIGADDTHSQNSSPYSALAIIQEPIFYTTCAIIWITGFLYKIISLIAGIIIIGKKIRNLKTCLHLPTLELLDELKSKLNIHTPVALQIGQNDELPYLLGYINLRI